MPGWNIGPNVLNKPIGSYYIAIKDNSVQGNFSLTSESNCMTTFICRGQDVVGLTTYLLTANSFNIAGYACELGAAHPIFTTSFCHYASPKPIGAEVGGYLTWNLWEIECKFKPFIFDPGAPVLRKKYSFDPCGFAVTIPPGSAFSSGTGYTYPDGEDFNTTVDNNYQPIDSFYIPLYKYSVTIYGCINLPLATINSMIGLANAAPFTIQCGAGASNYLSVSAPTTINYATPNNFTCAKGLCVYQGIGQTSMTTSTQGAGRYDITHVFMVSTIDQNAVPDWDLLSNTYSSQWVYTNGQMNILKTVMQVPQQLKYPYGDFTVLNPGGIF